MNSKALLQLQKYKGKIVWLASYPKSGNTWLRAFLTALFFDREPKINRLINDLNLYSKLFFEDFVSLEPSYQTPEEVKFYQKEMITLALEPEYSDRLLFSKTHYNEPYFIDETNTHKILYLVRNPLAIVPSLANHNVKSIEETIEYMKNSKAGYDPHENSIRKGLQFRHEIGTWNSHVSNWVRLPSKLLKIVKYEDLSEKPFETFSNILRHLELDFSEAAIKKAISISAFDNLKAQEEQSTFLEKNPRSKHFFRRGKANSWIEELTYDQRIRLVRQHRKVMEQLDYSTNLETYQIL